MSEVKYVEFSNFMNFGGEDEKQLVGLRQASGRRQKDASYRPPRTKNTV